MANGVPTLLNQVTSAFNQASLLFSDARLIFQIFQSSSWGIFEAGGNAALFPDSITSIDYEKQWVVASYPMERGSFQSYNKVQFPFGNQVRVTKGGSVGEKQDFLNTLETMAASLNLFDIVTPEQSYYNATIERLNVVRTSTNGAGLLSVDIAFIEVRETAFSSFTDVKTLGAKDPVNVGTVQAGSAQ